MGSKTPLVEGEGTGMLKHPPGTCTCDITVEERATVCCISISITLSIAWSTSCHCLLSNPWVHKHPGYRVQVRCSTPLPSTMPTSISTGILHEEYPSHPLHLSSEEDQRQVKAGDSGDSLLALGQPASQPE